MNNFSSRLSAYSLIGFTIAGTAITSPAGAADRMQTITETCESVQQSLLSNGRTLLIYPSATQNLTLHDIYVGSAGQCAFNEIGKNAVVRSSDTDQCSVILCVKEDAEPAPPPPIEQDDIIIEQPPQEVNWFYHSVALHGSGVI